MLPNKKPLKFGLNVFKPSASKPKAPLKNLFGNDNEPDEDQEAKSKVNKDIRLEALRAQSSKKVFNQIKDTLDVDPTAYEYDEVYDQMKSNQKKVTQEQKGPESRKPKYIEAALKAAELRKRDRLRAEEKMMEKEREMEGELYADKEKFITSGYKQQQEDLRKAEEEDNRIDDPNKLGIMSGFYKGMLDDRSKLLKAAIITNETKTESSKPIEREKTNDVVVEALKEGKDVELNEDNEIVDKRQLLSAGLNVVKKPSTKTLPDANDTSNLSAYEEFVQRRMKEKEEQKRLASEAQKKRLTKQIQAQLKEVTVQKEQESEKQLEELKAKLVRKNDESSISDAKARYLARKRAQTQESV